MKYFLDTEFHEYEIMHDVNTIELISIGVVAEDGREFYRLSSDFDLLTALKNSWLNSHVIQPIVFEFREEFAKMSASNKKFKQDLMVRDVFQTFGYNKDELKESILAFIGDDPNPEFYGYYCDYDWVVFCWLFGRMIDLPKYFPMYCRDLKQMLDESVSKLSNKDFLSEFDSLEELTFKQKLDLVKTKNPNYPCQENLHNALADARWNKQLYEFIQSLG